LFPNYVGVLIWGGLFLRDDRLRALSRCEVAQYEVAKEENDMKKITPFLWFEDKAEEAANFYTSIFKNSKILNIARYGEAGPGPKGTVMTVTFQLEGQEFMGLNGGPHYTFSPAISFFVNCETQAEVDELWEKLSAGGREDRCAWLTDKFGVSWQIVPKALFELIQDKDPVKSQRVFKAMLQMTKIDIEGLKRAYRGE
jgi:predicted 3-demethylubiquinone-9 3-methyltransferase (glyoxalase superfamily)